MAAKDVLDHEVLGSFSSRIAPAKSGRAAENIAYGYDSFDKTLNQWIGSSGHRKNLLLHKASRVGVASAKSATSSRTYWAMVIAGGYEPPPKAVAKGALSGSKRKTPVEAFDAPPACDRRRNRIEMLTEQRAPRQHFMKCPAAI
jgi:hypothetical protein